MKRLCQLFYVLIALFIVGCSTSSKSSRTILFNGQDFTGWTFVLADSSTSIDDVWRVENGVIHCQGVPNGYMRTVEAFSNYKLHVEWRWTENPTNSGVFLHCQEPDQVWPNAFECQLMADHAGDFVLIGPGSVTVGDTAYAITEGFEIIGKQHESSENPAGEWNVYDIAVDGSTIVAEVNGVVQNKGTNAALTSGFIALQSEGSPIEFRNVWVEPIK